MSVFNAIQDSSESFIHKRIVGAARGLFSGGPVGAIGGFLAPGGGAGRRLPEPTRIAVPRAFSPGRISGPVRVVPTPSVRGAIERFVPGGATGLQVAASPAGGCPQGFHPNKSSYMTAGGFVAEGSRCVRNRRRNLSNGRANKRALRRINAWDKQERQLGKTLKSIVRGR